MLPGARLGAYEIVSPLGTGGMGEVYRAADTRLGRAVAIKVLPDTFAADSERVPRFEREAKVLASLNHPHIAALYGMEKAEGRHFLIMELVEGQTLEDRLRAGSLSIDETLKVAVQIADALDAAHEQGIVHRDLKPANVKITPDGKVKVLDFGLAKAVEAGPTAQNPALSPTFTVMATQAGMIMGTAAYMSPEQAKGLTVDRRSDVFSFGVVLYEMLTGRQPFRGETAAEVMASVMLREADLAALPPTIHPRLRDIIARCLDKQPRQRWQSIGDLRMELEALRAAPQVTTSTALPAITRTQRWTRVLTIGAAIVLTAVSTALLVGRWRPAPARAVVRLSIPAIDMRLTTSALAIAPGGTAIAYVGTSANGAYLMIRRVDEFEARALEATRAQFISSPAFSPDGGSIAFFSNNSIRRVDVRGGAPIAICEVGENVRGISWHGSSLVFAAGSAIYRVADTSGAPQRIAQFENGQFATTPQLIDDAGTLLYTLASGPAFVTRQIVLQAPSGRRTVLAEEGVNPFYVAPGRVVYVNNGTVMAVPVDLRTGQPAGSAVRLVEGVTRWLTASPSFHVAASPDGALAYVPGKFGGTARRQLAFVQADGSVETLAIAPDFYGQPRLSPDGRQVAVESDDGKEAAVWVGPVEGNAPLRRLTFEGRNLAPVWTRDGQYVAFQSDRAGDRGVFLQRADGSEPAVRLTKTDPDVQHVPESWGPGDRLLTVRALRGNKSSIWIAARDGSQLKPLIQTDRSVGASAFSPDGHWIAYGSNEQKSVNVFVQPFPPTGVKYQLTTENTSTPVWSADGKQLYFVYTNRVFRADVRFANGLTLGPVTELAAASSLPSLPNTRHVDVTPDGKRLLVVVPEGPGGAERTSINVVLNWIEELNAKLPK